jgi:hypothetical protein
MEREREKGTITDNVLRITTTPSMCACLTREVLVKYPRGEEEEERIEFSQQTNSFCVTPSNATEPTRESGEEEGEKGEEEDDEGEEKKETKE